MYLGARASTASIVSGVANATCSGRRVRMIMAVRISTVLQFILVKGPGNIKYRRALFSMVKEAHFSEQTLHLGCSPSWVSGRLVR
jgi:hypothetical protein